MAKEKIRITFKSYDAKQLDIDIKKIIGVVTKTGSNVIGPIFLPTKKKSFCVNRSPHVDKKSREQFQYCIHKRLVYITDITQQTMNSLSKGVAASPGVDIKIAE